jgi:hypothetical protein
MHDTHTTTGGLIQIIYGLYHEQNNAITLCWGDEENKKILHMKPQENFGNNMTRNLGTHTGHYSQYDGNEMTI